MRRPGLLSAIVVLGGASLALGQDTVLSVMLSRAEIVAHVRVLDVQGGEEEEEGVEEWSALCQVIKRVKGPVKNEDKIRFRFTRFSFRSKREPALVEKGREYVVFLKGSSGSIRFRSDEKLEVAHLLLDKWVGALPYHYHLLTRLTDHLGNAK